jgi:hypothetical protein
MKRTILLSLSLLALLLAPGMAAAEQTAPAPAVQGCNDLSFLSAAPVTAASPAMPNLDPLAGVVEAQGGCCAAKLRQCQNNCACGVFEFNCDPATCQSSCICNIC